MFYKHFLPKNPVHFFNHSRSEKTIETMKNPYRIAVKIVVFFKMGRFTSQKASF